MRIAIAAVVFVSACSLAFGYWDIFDKGGRVTGITPASAALAGASLPFGGSPLQIFTNPSALAGTNESSMALGGWGTGWREEIHYESYCNEPYRYNKGGMTPRGTIAFALPVGHGFTLGAGIATVAQYEMTGSMQVYSLSSSSYPYLLKTMIADGSGDLNEAMGTVAGSVGALRLGISAGSRFGSGENTVYSNRTGGTAYDSTYHEEWESSSFAFRAGASMDAGYTRLYSTYVSGDDRYSSYAGLGASAAFPFLNGGFLGTELGFFDGDELFMNAYTSYPWAFTGVNVILGINGYRPDDALKAGMGFSYGMDYTFGANKFSAAYQWCSRYRNGTAIDTNHISWVYDSGESYVVGYERTF